MGFSFRFYLRRPSVILLMLILLTPSGILPFPVTIFGIPTSQHSITPGEGETSSNIEEVQVIKNIEEAIQERLVNIIQDVFLKIKETNADKRTLGILSRYTKNDRMKRSPDSMTPINNASSLIVQAGISVNETKIETGNGSTTTLRTTTCITDTKLITAPNDRLSLYGARWIIVFGGIVSTLLVILIVCVYCRCCTGRICRRSRRIPYDANPRATVTTLPPFAIVPTCQSARRATRLNNAPSLNNQSDLSRPRAYSDHHPRHPQGILDSENFQYMKALEKHPDRLTHLMLDL